MSSIPQLKGPKYLTLANRLKTQIEQGTLKPGDRLPSFTELRAQYGVTPTTVERIYSLLEQQQLIVRERGRGTFVRQPQERVTTGMIGIAGVTFAQQPHPYWARLMEGFQDAAARAGLELLLLNEASVIKWEKVDGLIIHETRAAHAQAMLRRLPPGMPCVSALIASREMVSVVADDYQGVYEMTQHLIQLGHRRIAYLFDPLSPRRVAGYHDALREAGIEGQACWLRPIHDEPDSPFCHYMEVGHRAMEQWLKDDWRALGCTALMTQNDDTAIGAIQVLRHAEISVPEQVSVTGFDGTEVGQYFTPRLTTVEVPLREIGVTAIETLLRQMGGEAFTISTLVLPTRLKIGRSSRAAKA